MRFSPPSFTSRGNTDANHFRPRSCGGVRRPPSAEWTESRHRARGNDGAVGWQWLRKKHIVASDHWTGAPQVGQHPRERNGHYQLLKVELEEDASLDRSGIPKRSFVQLVERRR